MILQAPIIYRRGFSVHLFNIHSRDFGIDLHDLQRTMAQQGLEREKIASRSQISHSHRVTKAVWITLFYLRFLTQGIDNLSQGISIKRVIIFTKKKVEQLDPGHLPYLPEISKLFCG